MQPKIYVGSIAYETSEEDLKKLFGQYGTVTEANVIRDSYTGKSKGFAFVQFASGAEAEKALEQNGQEFMGRKIIVSEARPPREDSRGGGGGGRGRGGFGGGGGGDRGGRGGGGRRY